MFVHSNQSVFRLINIFCVSYEYSAKQYQRLSMLIHVFLCVKMQRFIFLVVHLIEHKIFGQPTIVFVILVTNIIEKGPFTCICAGYIFQLYVHGFSYYLIPCMTNITKSQFPRGLKERREGGIPFPSIFWH